MNRPNFTEVRETPLPTSAELVPHLQKLLQPALRRQVWIVLLDTIDRPLPTLLPIDMPAEPSFELADALAECLNCLALEFTGVSLAITFERPGPAEIVDRDRRWMRALREAALGSGARFRGPFLMLGETVCEPDPLEYQGIPWVYFDDDEDFDEPYDRHDHQGSVDPARPAQCGGAKGGSHGGGTD